MLIEPVLNNNDLEIDVRVVKIINLRFSEVNNCREKINQQTLKRTPHQVQQF